MWDWITKLAELNKIGAPFSIATVVASKGSSPRKIGAKMAITKDGNIYGTIGGGNLEKLVIEDSKKCLESGTPQVFNYPLTSKVNQCCGGTVDVLIEVVGIGPRLFLFGAGHVSQAICHTLQGTPFQLHIVDGRKEWLHHPNFPVGVIRHEECWDELILNTEWNPNRDFAVVLTHDHGLDFSIIEDLMKRPLRYRGLIGSDTKWKKFQREFKDGGYTDQEIASITCPIGIGDLGNAPQEVAVSFAAEILGMIKKDNS